MTRTREIFPVFFLTLILTVRKIEVYGEQSTRDTQICTVRSDIVDCSGREFDRVPDVPISDTSVEFPVVFNLSHNFISNITGESFRFVLNWPEPTNPVSELYLDHNCITYMAEISLHPFTRSKVLDLSWNHMAAIPEKLFSVTEELQRLSLAGNPIGKLSFTLPKSLEELNVSSCGLSSMGEDKFVGRNLTTLDISNNSLTSINLSLITFITVRLEPNPWDCEFRWQYRRYFASDQTRCTTTTGVVSTTPSVANNQSSTTSQQPDITVVEAPEELLWSSIGIVEGVLFGWMVYFLLLGSAAWIRVRTLRRTLARDGNWWLDQRL